MGEIGTVESSFFEPVEMAASRACGIEKAAEVAGGSQRVSRKHRNKESSRHERKRHPESTHPPHRPPLQDLPNPNSSPMLRHPDYSSAAGKAVDDGIEQPPSPVTAQQAPLNTLPTSDLSFFDTVLANNQQPPGPLDDTHSSIADQSIPLLKEMVMDEVRSAPLFSAKVRRICEQEDQRNRTCEPSASHVFPQYGLLGVRLATFGYDVDKEPRERSWQDGELRDEDNIYANMDEPWSTFICGSQGGGKSHTLSCMLENSLLSSSPAGILPNPLAGIVFHYDKFTSYSSTQLCEAAYLCSAGVPVRVLVSPSNIWAMRKLYADLPGLAVDAPRPQVIPLRLQERHLNVTNIMTLMAVGGSGSFTPLYLEVLYKILREMASERRGRPGLDYRDFKERLIKQAFTKDQLAPLSLRLQLLESLLEPSTVPVHGQPELPKEDIWKFEKGSLTIVDLSCPFVNEDDACALFTICLGLFLENRGEGGRVVALDEAHKVIDHILYEYMTNEQQFLTQSGEAIRFTDQLTSIICQQRHLATRIIIATQEPTLSPRLLDLCNVTIAHRFLSPAWFDTLKSHLAGVASSRGDSGIAVDDIFRTIVALRTGEALVFSPTAMLDIWDPEPDSHSPQYKLQTLQAAYVKLRIRDRFSADGGKSIMASDRVDVHEANMVQNATTSPELIDLTEDAPRSIPWPELFSNHQPKLRSFSNTVASGSGSVLQPQGGPLGPLESLRSHSYQATNTATATTNTALGPTSDKAYDSRPLSKSPSLQSLPASTPRGPVDNREYVVRTKGAATRRLDYGAGFKRQLLLSISHNKNLVDFRAIRRSTARELGLDLGYFNNPQWRRRSRDIIEREIGILVRTSGLREPNTTGK